MLRSLSFPAPHTILTLALALGTSSGLAHGQQTSWVGSWASSQQIPEPANALPADDLRDATLRQTMHLSTLGTGQLRVHLSNAFGTAALRITSVHLARPVAPGASAVVPATDSVVRFSGSTDVLIPPGAEYLSDPIPFTLNGSREVAVTLHLDDAPARQTGHPGSRSTSWVAHGDQVAASDLTGAKKVEHWYFVSGIDVSAMPGAYSVVALGDSITDGHATTTNGNDRWPDVLAARLAASTATRNVGVLNQGIGGNHMLTDGLGPNVLARFDRDVLAQPGAKVVILLEAINDLGMLSREGDQPAERHTALVHAILSSYEQVIARAHAQGVKVIGATVTPDVGSDYYHPSPANEADRQAINRWVRSAGHFDGVIDFDRVVADPANPERLLPAYDCGDHLHPSPAGYKAMADAIPLGLLKPF